MAKTRKKRGARPRPFRKKGDMKQDREEETVDPEEEDVEDEETSQVPDRKQGKRKKKKRVSFKGEVQEHVKRNPQAPISSPPDHYLGGLSAAGATGFAYNRGLKTLRTSSPSGVYNVGQDPNDPRRARTLTQGVNTKRRAAVIDRKTPPVVFVKQVFSYPTRYFYREPFRY